MEEALVTARCMQYMMLVICEEAITGCAGPLPADLEYLEKDIPKFIEILKRETHRKVPQKTKRQGTHQKAKA
jgi:hypothetical protein